MVRLRSRARVGGRDVLFSRVRREKADVSAREATPSREVRFYHHLAKKRGSTMIWRNLSRRKARRYNRYKLQRRATALRARGSTVVGVDA